MPATDHSITQIRTYGWIGLGAMGFPMAGNLHRMIPPESTIHIYDINPQVLKRFVEENTPDGSASLPRAAIGIATCARDVAEKSECIITIVPEGAHVKAVYLTEGTGLLAANDTSGRLFIDCSTIDIETSLHIGEAVQKSCLGDDKPHFYDAPVSGGTAGAEAASLTFMVGAHSKDPLFPVLKEIFSSMGKNIYTLGGPSLGLAAKLSNNYLSGLIALATSEAMNLGMRLGLNPHVLSQCFATSSGGSWVNSTVNPVPGVCPDAVTSKGYNGGFKVQLMKKDMGLAIQAAKQVGAKLVLADAGLAAYSAAAEDPRCQDRDSRVVYRWLGGVEPEH